MIIFVYVRVLNMHLCQKLFDRTQNKEFLHGPTDQKIGSSKPICPLFSKAEHYNTIFFFLKLISCKYLAHNFSPSLLLVRLLFSVDAVCIKYYVFLPVYWYVVLNFSRTFFQRFSHGHFRNGWNHLMKRILKCKIIIEFVNYWCKVIIELLMLIECA